MRGHVVIPGDYPETEGLMDHLGFSFKRLVDPRPGALLRGRKRRRRRRPGRGPLTKGLAWAARERMRRIRPPVRSQGALPTRVVLPVASEESVHALSDLGIKFHISRKWRKRIGIAAAVGTAAYFGGAALAAKFGTKAVAKGAASGALKVGRKKLAKKAKKALRKVGGAAKTVAQAQALPVVPGSVDYEAAAARGELIPGMPGTVQEGGGGSPLTEGGESLAPEVGEPPVEKAGLGGWGTILIGGGLLAALMASRKRR